MIIRKISSYVVEFKGQNYPKYRLLLDFAGSLRVSSLSPRIHVFDSDFQLVGTLDECIKSAFIGVGTSIELLRDVANEELITSIMLT